MDAVKILFQIRRLESALLMQYIRLSSACEIDVANLLDLSFDQVRQLKDTSSDIQNNLVTSFNANTSTLFTLSSFEESRATFSDLELDEIRQIRSLERKIVLELRELCLRFPTIAFGCCGLSRSQIDQLINFSSSELTEHCYTKKSSILKIRFNPRGLLELARVASKPCFSQFAWLHDKLAI